MDPPGGPPGGMLMPKKKGGGSGPPGGPPGGGMLMPRKNKNSDSEQSSDPPGSAPGMMGPPGGPPGMLIPKKRGGNNDPPSGPPGGPPGGGMLMPKKKGQQSQSTSLPPGSAPGMMGPPGGPPGGMLMPKKKGGDNGPPGGPPGGMLMPKKSNSQTSLPPGSTPGMQGPPGGPPGGMLMPKKKGGDSGPPGGPPGGMLMPKKKGGDSGPPGGPPGGMLMPKKKDGDIGPPGGMLMPKKKDSGSSDGPDIKFNRSASQYPDSQVGSIVGKKSPVGMHPSQSMTSSNLGKSLNEKRLLNNSGSLKSDLSVEDLDSEVDKGTLDRDGSVISRDSSIDSSKGWSRLRANLGNLKKSSINDRMKSSSTGGLQIPKKGRARSGSISMLASKLFSKTFKRPSSQQQGHHQIFDKLKGQDAKKAKLHQTTLNPFTLAFSDQEFEAEYLKHYFKISEKQVHIAVVVAVIAILLFTIADEIEMGFETWSDLRTQLVILRAVMISLVLAFWYLTYTEFFKQHWQLLMVAMFCIAGVLFSIVALFKRSVGMLFICIFFVFIFLVPRLRFIYATLIAAVAFVAFDVVYWVVVIDAGQQTASDFLSFNALIGLTLVLCMYTAHHYESVFRQDFRLKRIVEIEQEKTNNLLLNMLPESVVTKLKAGRHLIADQFQEVTVLLSDIVGFTNLAAQMTPTQLVPLMNKIYSKFDDLSTKLDVFKLETIGDAYMAVCGLPTPRADHADAMAQMAIAMQEAMVGHLRPNGEPLQIRVGLHSGAVIAGVVSAKKMPRYWVWGETVEVTEKMEHTGEAGRTQVSESTYRLLKHLYDFEERVNEKATRADLKHTYFIQGRKKFANVAQNRLRSNTDSAIVQKYKDKHKVKSLF